MGSEHQRLANHPMFAGVTEAALTKIIPSPQSKTVRNGQTVFERDDTSCSVYLVHSGSLVAVFLDSTGRELTFGRIPAGAYFGELSAIDGQRRSLTVYGVEDTEVSILPQDIFLSAIEALPEVRQRVMQKLASLVRGLTDRSYQQTAMSVDSRLRTYLVQLALQNNAMRDGAIIEGVPTHAEIANTIGANREAVSRAVSKLKKAKVIDAGRQRIQVLQADILIDGGV